MTDTSKCLRAYAVGDEDVINGSVENYDFDWGDPVAPPDDRCRECPGGCDRCSCGCRNRCGCQNSCNGQNRCGCQDSCGCRNRCGCQDSCNGQGRCGCRSSCSCQNRCGCRDSCGWQNCCSCQNPCCCEAVPEPGPEPEPDPVENQPICPFNCGGGSNPETNDDTYPIIDL